MCLADVVQGIVVLRFLRLFPQPRQEVHVAPVQKRDDLEFYVLRELEQDAVLDQGAFPILKLAHWR